jgi:hypothetical protein
MAESESAPVVHVRCAMRGVLREEQRTETGGIVGKTKRGTGGWR